MNKIMKDFKNLKVSIYLKASGMVSEVNFAGRMLFLYNGFWDLINVPVPDYLQIVTEDSVMHSYVVIDNKGNVLDNFNDNYVIVGNLLKEPFDKVIEKYNISVTTK